MRVEVNVLESGIEPGVSVQDQPALMMAFGLVPLKWARAVLR
jgi:hypothetical protein